MEKMLDVRQQYRPAKRYSRRERKKKLSVSVAGFEPTLLAQPELKSGLVDHLSKH